MICYFYVKYKNSNYSLKYDVIGIAHPPIERSLIIFSPHSVLMIQHSASNAVFKLMHVHMIACS